jgi:hypothetical protein
LSKSELDTGAGAADLSSWLARMVNGKSKASSLNVAPLSN